MTTDTTPAPKFTAPSVSLTKETSDTLLLNIAETVARLSLARRDALLREVASIEAEHGYGTQEKPSTAQLRARWKKHRGYCPECGKRLEV